MKYYWNRKFPLAVSVYSWSALLWHPHVCESGKYGYYPHNAEEGMPHCIKLAALYLSEVVITVHLLSYHHQERL